MASFSLNTLKFEDVKAQIISFLKSNSDYYATFDFEGSNLNYVIDAMAFVTMQMSYQVSNVANNIFLDSTEIRKNAVSIAKTMGYRPRRITPSRSDIEVTYFDETTTFTTNSTIIIPAGSSFISEKGNLYINEANIQLNYKGPNTLFGVGPVFQGIQKQFNQISNGLPFQNVVISSAKISEIGFSLYIQDSITYNNRDSILWTELANTFSLQDKNSYLVEEDLNNEGYVKIIFGDGLIMNYPPAGKIILIKYQEALGSSSNGEFLSTIPSIPVSAYGVSNIDVAFDISKLSLISNKSYNGNDIESIESIRYNAPISYANVGRLVTENDYNSYLSSYKLLKKAKAIGGDILFPGDQTKLGNIYITGLPNTFDGLNLSSLYLTETTEAELSQHIAKFRIISTKINFYKPSYIFVDITPTIEINKHSLPEQEKFISETVVNTLKDFININFSDFNPQFRSTKLIASLENISETISNYLIYNYYFIVMTETFYNNDSDIINLPIIIQGYDTNYNVNSSKSFVRTNKDNKIFLGFPNETDIQDVDNFTSIDYTKDKSTIYGKINHDILNRYIYNVDTNNNSCELKLTGENIIANVFNYENHLNTNVITNLVTATAPETALNLSLNPIISNMVSSSPYINNSSVSGYYEEYALTTGTTTAGIIYRTDSKNNGFKGLVRRITDMSPSANIGDFMECVVNIWIGTSDYLNFQELRKGEYIIFTDSGWIKTVNKGNISAIEGSQFYNSIPASVLANTVFSVSGTLYSNIGDYVTSNVSGGDEIIFNFSSTAIPMGKWQKVRWRNDEPYTLLNGLDASTSLPTIVEPFQIKIVVDLDVSSDLNGRLSIPISSQDLIFYNSTASGDETQKWQTICNYSPTADLIKINATFNSLDLITLSTSAIGTSDGYFIVTGDPGNFGDTTRIDWPFDLPIEERIAIAGDVLLYKGDVNGFNRFNIYLQSYSNLYTLDGLIPTSLPISADYGDSFNISSSGTFNDYFNTPCTTADNIIYIGNENWIIKNISGGVPDSSSNSIKYLPKPGTIGDVLMINVDGSFNNNLIEGTIAPLNDQFVQGDYIVYTGNAWTKLREYSFQYTNLNYDNGLNAKITLNNLGLNAVFSYNYNNEIGQYEMIFKDIYDEAILGTMIYTSIENDYSKVGKIIFNEYVSGSYWINTPVSDIKIKTVELFKNNTTPNKIKMLPVIRSDNSIEEDFDTAFDNYLITNILTPNIIKTIL
jgi:hypothetical protein